MDSIHSITELTLLATPNAQCPVHPSDPQLTTPTKVLSAPAPISKGPPLSPLHAPLSLSWNPVQIIRSVILRWLCHIREHVEDETKGTVTFRNRFSLCVAVPLVLPHPA